MVTTISKADVDALASSSIVFKKMYAVTGSMSRSPRKWSALTLLSMVFITMVLGASTWSNTVPGEFDWIIAETKYSEMTDAIGFATGEVDPIVEVDEGEVKKARTFPSDWHTMTYIYEREDRKDESILTPEFVQTMCQTEGVLATHEAYGKLCLLTEEEEAEDAEDAECSTDAMKMSLPLKFYGVDHDWSCPLLGADVVETKVTELVNSLSSDVGMLLNGIHFDKETMTKGYPTMVRTYLQFGGPLEGFAGPDDRLNEQNGEYEKLVKPWEEVFNKEYFGKAAPGFGGSYYMTPSVKNGVQVTYWGFDLQQLEFLRLVQSDMFFSMFAMMFVYLWMTVHTGSPMLSSVGMLQIVCSLPIGCGIYKLGFGIPYFDTLQTLVIFLVLGVGADDVFVLADAWKQSSHTVEREE